MHHVKNMLIHQKHFMHLLDSIIPKQVDEATHLLKITPVGHPMGFLDSKR